MSPEVVTAPKAGTHLLSVGQSLLCGALGTPTSGFSTLGFPLERPLLHLLNYSFLKGPQL